MQLSSERLSGVVAGILAVKSVQAAAPPISWFVSDLVSGAMAPEVYVLPLLVASGLAVLSAIYIFRIERRLFHIVASIVMLLLIGQGFTVALTPFMLGASEAKDDIEMVVSGVAGSILGVLGFGCALALVLREKETAEPGATDNPDGAQRFREDY